jgi:hypothetical protein
LNVSVKNTKPDKFDQLFCGSVHHLPEAFGIEGIRRPHGAVDAMPASASRAMRMPMRRSVSTA